ncbi:MAG: diaminopimelate epimerase [Pseudomonadota bacterium]
MQLKFSKMHGLGNDFMVLDLVTQQWDVDQGLVARWADRHTGIGFDQLLVLAPPRDPEADFACRFFNTDGSEAEQCGNGARCIARFANERGLSPKAELKFQTNTGSITARVRDTQFVEVDLGAPILEPSAVPFAPPNESDDQGRYRINAAGVDYSVFPVSMGNPHGVIFVDSVSDTPVADIGPALTGHPAFPEQANIGFCQVIDDSFIRLRVHERGVGETRACGSGACAAVVAAHRLGQVGDKVKVSLPGGKVRVTIERETGHVLLSGPASLVYHGTLELS